eukprot:g8264.t1
MSSERVLYWASGSPPCWRVLLALEEKGLEYDSRLLEFSKNGHKSDEVLAVNPRGQLPAFKDGKNIVNESAAAVLYLDMTYPDLPFLPNDSESKAKVLQRFFEIISMSDNIRAYIRPKMMSKEDPNEAQHLETMVNEFKVWDAYLSKTTYVATDHFSAADILFIPSVMFLRRFGMTFKDYPNLARYVKMADERPSVAKTSPPHWKESQGPPILSMF